MIVVKDADIIKTVHNENDITIHVKSLQNVAWSDAGEKFRYNWSEFWGDFATEFLSQDFIAKHNFTTKEKIEITHFIKFQIKKKLQKG